MIEDQHIIDKLKQNDLTALDKAYITFKKEFFLFARTFSVSDEDIADVYQDTMISFYENVQSGKLHTLTSSLKTYLFAIGRFKLYKQIGKNKNQHFDEQVIYASEEIQVFDIDVSEERKILLKNAFVQLGEKCQKILDLYYYKGMTLDETQDFLGYSTKDVLKNQKSRCLKQLKDLVKESYA